MEELREKLYKHIDQYGVQDTRTLEVSKELNKLILEDMKVGA